MFKEFFRFIGRKTATHKANDEISLANNNNQSVSLCTIDSFQLLFTVNYSNRNSHIFFKFFLKWLYSPGHTVDSAYISVPYPYFVVKRSTVLRLSWFQFTTQNSFTSMKNFTYSIFTYNIYADLTSNARWNYLIHFGNISHFFLDDAETQFDSD